MKNYIFLRTYSTWTVFHILRISANRYSNLKQLNDNFKRSMGLSIHGEKISVIKIACHSPFKYLVKREVVLESIIGVKGFWALGTGELVLAVYLLMLQQLVLMCKSINHPLHTKPNKNVHIQRPNYEFKCIYRCIIYNFKGFLTFSNILYVVCTPVFTYTPICIIYLQFNTQILVFSFAK